MHEFDCRGCNYRTNECYIVVYQRTRSFIVDIKVNEDPAESLCIMVRFGVKAVRFIHSQHGKALLQKMHLCHMIHQICHARILPSTHYEKCPKDAKLTPKARCPLKLRNSLILPNSPTIAHLSSPPQPSMRAELPPLVS